MDLTLPGYKYLGPFNKLNKGTPTSYNDFVAYVHDHQYGEIIEKGGNPYLYWSKADARAYRHFTHDEYGGTIGKFFFGLKKRLFELGVISEFTSEEIRMPRNKRLRTEDERAIVPYEPNEVEEMEIEYDGNAVESTRAATTATSSGRSNGTHETPVTIPPQVPYGMFNTHTCWIPITFWLNARKYTNTVAANLFLRMDKPKQPITNTLVTGTNGGINVNKINPGTMNNTQEPFPRTLSTTPTLTPQWWDIFSKLYEFYTVLGCQYEIFVQNANQENSNQLLIGQRFETEGTGGTTSTIPTNATIWETMQMKDIDFRNLYSHSNPFDKPYETVYKGYYKRGDANRDVRNDDDVKLWSRTNSQPALAEYMRFMFYNAPLSSTDADLTGCNMQITLRYKVQFKDLHTSVRFPTQAGVPITTIYPSNVLIDY